MLASMSQLEWSELGVSGLPTGTVTLLLADVEGSTRLWQEQPEEMTAAVARLDRAVCDIVAASDGVRPVVVVAVKIQLLPLMSQAAPNPGDYACSA